MNFMELFANHPIVGQALAGFAGGFVRSVTPPYAGFMESVSNVTVGGICAVYLGPWGVAFFEKISGSEISSDGSNLGAFLMGLGGITVSSFFIDAFKIAKRDQDKGERDDSDA